VHATLSSDARHADSLLLVFGDHGMTHAGDHGGGTPEEVTSALFAASFRSSAGAGAQRDARAPPAAAAVPQLDFAVSLALLLGLPVPFGSLGTLSKELWQLGAPGGGDEGFAEALQANSAQVRRALLTYGQRGAFAAADVQRLERLFDAAAAAEGEAALLGALAQAAALARRQWTQFDARAMAAGLALFCLSLALHARACWRGLLTWRARELSGWGDSKFAPLALFSLAAALAHALGCFSVGFMQNEQAAGHWPAIAVSVAHALASAIPPSSFSVSRRHAAAAVALLLVSGALYLARMTGEDKLGGATSSLSALCGTVLSLLMLPAILLRPHAMQGAARSGRRGSPQRPLSLLAFSLLLLRSLLPPHSLLARIALPRLVYALAVVNLALAALTGGWRHNACLAALLPPLAMLCGRRGPLLALLALLQGASLLRCHSPAAAAVAAPAESTHSLSRASEAARLLLWRSDAWRLLSLAAGLHCASLQLFSATGHRSSFDALHFSAAFTGFDSFSFGTQGALLAANTWAADLGGLAALPLAAAALSHGRPGAWRALRLLVLCRAALRLVEAACAAAAAAVLRRHLHVWSHFAPKFVFEAVGLLLIDALLLLMLMLAPRDTAGGKDEMDKTE
jgi:phosphatidylinositol glycan class O